MDMKLCRFELNGQVCVGLSLDGQNLINLTAAGIERLTPLLESDNLSKRLVALAKSGLPIHKVAAVRLLAPVERQEVWAAGVTYLRSKKARMEESDFSATAYDRVYDAPRPEIFFKSLAEKVVATGEPVGIRRDAKWNVPEPELALVISSRGEVVGYTAGNDMSSRDIEGENLLYLPQAKVYDRSCALAPWIAVGVSESQVRQWNIGVKIVRKGKVIFAGAQRRGDTFTIADRIMHIVQGSLINPIAACVARNQNRFQNGNTRANEGSQGAREARNSGLSHQIAKTRRLHKEHIECGPTKICFAQQFKNNHQ